MSSTAPNFAASTEQYRLDRYYFARAGFSLAWVALALTLGQGSFLAGAVLLVVYPLWDAAANYVDATRSGGLGRNRIQAINIVISSATALAVLVALQGDLQAVLAVFGGWAILSGLLQLAAAVRRWASGAQWAMVLSGAQSALAGGFFVAQSAQEVSAVIPLIAGYAGFGAIYFLVSALWLVLGKRPEPGARP